MKEKLIVLAPLVLFLIVLFIKETYKFYKSTKQEN